MIFMTDEKFPNGRAGMAIFVFAMIYVSHSVPRSCSPWPIQSVQGFPKSVLEGFSRGFNTLTGWCAARCREAPI